MFFNNNTHHYTSKIFRVKADSQAIPADQIFSAF